MRSCGLKEFQGKTIIYFGGFNRYNFLNLWQRTQEVACWLATGNRLIYVEHLPPTNEGWLVYLYNLIRRMVGPRRSACRIKSIEFFFPVIIPLPGIRIIRRLNRYLIDRQIQRLLRRSPDLNSQAIWINWLSSYAYDYAQVSSAFTIYDCIQNYQSMAYPPSTRELDKLLTKQADLVFTDSLTNHGEKLKSNSNVHYVPQGLKSDWLSLKTTDMPNDLQNLKKPILGYVGSFHNAFDFRLFSYIAYNKPEWTFVIVGKPNNKAQELANLENVVLLGAKLHHELPAYISHFDVALIPYTIDDLTEGVFPTKLFEYLCFGKPVVSTFLPSLAEYAQFVRFAYDSESFIKECESALQDDGSSVKARIEVASENTWNKRFEDMSTILDNTLAIYDSKNGNKEVEAARMGKRHVVLIGLNFSLERNTGDKNFWVELIPFLAAGLDRITIFSVKSNAVPEEELIINNCTLRIKYLAPRFLEVPDLPNKRSNVFWRPGKFPAFLGVIEKLLNAKRLKKELDLLLGSYPYSCIHLMDNLGLTNRLIANSAKAPVSVSAMAYQGKRPEWLYKQYLRISYGHNNLTVIPYSKSFERRLVEQGFNRRKIQRIPWGIKPINLNCYAHGDNIGSRKPLILWAGYIQQIDRDDFEFAYRAAKRSLAQGLDARFMFAFKPESFDNGFESYDDPANNIMVRSTTSKEFLELQQIANVFLSPVTNSKCILAPPLTWLEMLSLGVPIVTLDTPGASEAVIFGETGYLATSEEDIVQKLFLAVKNYHHMRDKCINLVERKYNLVDISEEYLALFNDFTGDSYATIQGSRALPR